MRERLPPVCLEHRGRGNIRRACDPPTSPVAQLGRRRRCPHGGPVNTRPILPHPSTYPPETNTHMGTLRVSLYTRLAGGIRRGLVIGRWRLRRRASHRFFSAVYRASASAPRWVRRIWRLHARKTSIRASRATGGAYRRSTRRAATRTPPIHARAAGEDDREFTDFT